MGDHFLATIVPQIMATAAYKNNGAIIIWNDETEGGDNTTFTNTEIVISPLAHLNVNGVPYASNVAVNHSSDIKTMEEIFQLGSTLNNAIPSLETSTTGSGFNDVATVNDLSDLFQTGAIPATVPEPTSLGVAGLAGLILLRQRPRRLHSQVIT